MKAKELKEKYLNFFKHRKHRLVPNVPLAPENDSSALFISAGMHPLVPYLLGQSHPSGKRLVSLQRCLRTTDIDKVGNSTHNSFFEMLGNWSLGDYWKKEAISWSFEFLTKELGIDKEKLSVTCFAGDKNVPKDNESASLWQSLGILSSRIFFLGQDNWWGPIGQTGPCGPDSEMFIDTGKEACGRKCQPGCPCGKYVEIWNNVFMEYNQTVGGRLQPLKQKNVDTGMGVERTTAVLQGESDVYKTELFWPAVEEIKENSNKKYQEESKESIRIVADHLKAATFLIVDGVRPSNKEQGYVLRRLLRRAAVKMFTLGGGLTPVSGFQAISERVLLMEDYASYFDVTKDRESVFSVIAEEIGKFSQTLDKGLCFVQKIKHFDGKVAFDLYQTYGFPLEITQELASQKGQLFQKEQFEAEFRKHQTLSRTSASKKFTGGLVDHSEKVTKLHTATHLLQAVLKEVLGPEVSQKGSNITSERLRFDFSWKQKLTSQEIEKIQSLVNEKIKQNLPVAAEVMSLKEACQKGAIALFGQKYQNRVKIYRIGSGEKPFSFEVCGGPHVSFTVGLGSFKIIKEESAGAGIRRIYADLA